LELRGPLQIKQSSYDWKPFTAYPVLDYEEGRKTKKVYDEKGLEKAYTHIYSVCTPIIMNITAGKNLVFNKETASLLDCYIGMAKEIALKMGRDSRAELHVMLRSCIDYMLEYNLRTFDYYSFITVLADVAILYAKTAISDEECQIAEFAAKCCRAMYPDACYDDSFVVAVFALYLCSLKRKNNIDANTYANEFLGLPSKLTDYVVPGLREYLIETIKPEGQ
jgi:hypothetical protein